MALPPASPENGNMRFAGWVGRCLPEGIIAVSESFVVSVPATTANLGPGFDCLGAALTRYNRIVFRPGDSTEPLQIRVAGQERDRVPTDASNLLYVAFEAFFQQMGQTVPPIRLEITLDVPLARGLGSSSTAIVGGLLGANAIAGFPLSLDELAAIATQIEGHPDNVVPALLGGCRLATTDDAGNAILCAIPWHADILPIVVIPAFEVATAKARSVLPATYSRADAIYNVGHVGLLIRALATGNGEWLRVAMGDRIHVPYRQTLIPGYDAVTQAALTAGAYGVTISGAGPTLLALGSPDTAVAIAEAMATAWRMTGIDVVSALPLQIDTIGATVEPIA